MANVQIGYRVMAAASGRHVARLLFQSASVLIADLVRRGLLAGSSWPKRQIDQF